MTTDLYCCSAGRLALPVGWRRAQRIVTDDEVRLAVYRGALTIWRGDDYRGSRTATVRSNGAVHVPAALRRALGWCTSEAVEIEWTADDDTLIARGRGRVSVSVRRYRGEVLDALGMARASGAS